MTSHAAVVPAMLDEHGNGPCASPGSCSVCSLLVPRNPGESLPDYGRRLLATLAKADPAPVVAVSTGKRPRRRRADAAVPLTPFAHYLGVMRRASGITQMALAEQIGVHWRTIQGYEGGTIEPTAGAVAKLADLFGVTMDAMWRGFGGAR